MNPFITTVAFLAHLAVWAVLLQNAVEGEMKQNTLLVQSGFGNSFSQAAADGMSATSPPHHPLSAILRVLG